MEDREWIAQSLGIVISPRLTSLVDGPSQLLQRIVRDFPKRRVIVHTIQQQSIHRWHFYSCLSSLTSIMGSWYWSDWHFRLVPSRLGVCLKYPFKKKKNTTLNRRSIELKIWNSIVAQTIKYMRIDEFKIWIRFKMSTI